MTTIYIICRYHGVFSMLVELEAASRLQQDFVTGVVGVRGIIGIKKTNQTATHVELLLRVEDIVALEVAAS